MAEENDLATDFFCFPHLIPTAAPVALGQAGRHNSKLQHSSVFRQGSLFDLELLYDFRTDLFVDAFGVMDSLKQLTITQLMHYVNPASAKNSKLYGTKALENIAPKLQLSRPAE
ncbi:MAG TPA: hypothetical protein VIF10_18295 [Methylobacter sp.]